MKVNINAVHFTADGKLKDHISEKLSKLVKFYDKLLGVEVFLKLENSGQVRDKVVELEAKLPGRVIFASATDKSFEASLDTAQEIISRQLKRSKEKLKKAS
ncbi:MAG: ribosome-associated translation inhibitor RaiA [Saprospiraceae bacterium]|nr:ribosome-associated translation inhibitor RaiA [Saprospiraceae bacterium]